MAAVAALISSDDLELLEALEDRYDVESVRQALAQSHERIPWSKVKERLGLYRDVRTLSFAGKGNEAGSP